MGDSSFKPRKRSNSYRDQELLNNLGKQIKKTRQGKGRSIEDIHSKNEILERSWISKLECGKMNPTISTLGLLADELGTNVKTFFEFETED